MKMTPGITAVQRVKQKKLKTLHTKNGSLSFLVVSAPPVYSPTSEMHDSIRNLKQLPNLSKIPKPLFVGLTQYSIYYSE